MWIEFYLSMMSFRFLRGVEKMYFRYALPFGSMVKSRRLKREKPSFGARFYISNEGCSWLMMMFKSIIAQSVSSTISSFDIVLIWTTGLLSTVCCT